MSNSRQGNVTTPRRCPVVRNVKKHVFAVEIFREIFKFLKFLKNSSYGQIVPDTALGILGKKIKLCATINTVNGSMKEKGKVIIKLFCVTYAGLESKNHIALQTEY